MFLILPSKNFNCKGMGRLICVAPISLDVASKSIRADEDESIIELAMMQWL